MVGEPLINNGAAFSYVFPQSYDKIKIFTQDFQHIIFSSILYINLNTLQHNIINHYLLCRGRIQNFSCRSNAQFCYNKFVAHILLRISCRMEQRILCKNKLLSIQGIVEQNSQLHLSCSSILFQHSTINEFLRNY